MGLLDVVENAREWPQTTTSLVGKPQPGLVTLAINPPLSVAVATKKKNVLLVVEVAVSRPPDHVVSVVDHAAEEVASEVDNQHFLMLSNCYRAVCLLLCGMCCRWVTLVYHTTRLLVVFG